MEPSFSTITIDKEIKFKKSDLETLKYSENGFVQSEIFWICNFLNEKYFLNIYPNGHEKERRGRTLIFFYVKIGKAVKIETDIQCFFESPDILIYVKRVFEASEGCGDLLCTTEELFDSKKNFFVIDEMIIKVKGTMKIYLPPNKIAYPISAQWTINKKEVEEKNYLATEEFQFSPDPELKYCLFLCPNGIKDHIGEARIFLNLDFGTTVTIIEAVYNISINSANFSYDLEYVFEKTFGWGIGFCFTKNLFDADKNFFIDDKLIFNVTGTFFMGREEPKTPILDVQEDIIMKDVQTINQKDFTIMVGEKNIKVHKQLLLDSSPYFIGLFNSGMIESIEMKTTITDFDSEIVEAGIQILYDPTKIPPNFSFEQMFELLRFSDKYDIQIIKDLLQNHFIKNLSPTNVCQIINFTSTTVSAPKLYTECVEYIINCSKESKTVHGLETLDKELMAEIFIQTFTKKFST